VIFVPVDAWRKDPVDSHEDNELEIFVRARNFAEKGSNIEDVRINHDFKECNVIAEEKEFAHICLPCFTIVDCACLNISRDL
jgi:hypothetical protein